MHNDDAESQKLEPADAPVLLATLIAARRTGDRLLETVGRRELQERHEIKVRFLGGRTIAGVPHGR